MQLKVLFTTSKRIHQKFDNLVIGKYTIEPIPTSSPNSTGATNRYLLLFDDELKGGSSHPNEDAKLFLSYLSLILGSKVKIESVMTDSAQFIETRTESTFKEYYSVIEELPDLDLMLQRLQSLENDIARQYLRACEVYRTALRLIDENNTLSFFLLTIAIECLSNKASKKEGKCEKFVDFILNYLPDKSDFKSTEEWNEILKEIYYNHRSGFTHGGKRVPEAVRLADELDRIYVRNTINDKEVKTPSLKWFERIARTSIISFLNSQKIKEGSQNKDYFKEISLEHGIIKLKLRTARKKGDAIREKDVDLD